MRIYSYKANPSKSEFVDKKKPLTLCIPVI